MRRYSKIRCCCVFSVFGTVQPHSSEPKPSKSRRLRKQELGLPFPTNVLDFQGVPVGDAKSWSPASMKALRLSIRQALDCRSHVRTAVPLDMRGR